MQSRGSKRHHSSHSNVSKTKRERWTRESSRKRTGMASEGDWRRSETRRRASVLDSVVFPSELELWSRAAAPRARAAERLLGPAKPDLHTSSRTFSLALLHHGHLEWNSRTI